MKKSLMMQRRRFKNRKDVSGALLLEMLFMIAIMLVIFPIIYRSIEGRTDEIRNKMIVKDMMKVKIALENMLKRKPAFLELPTGQNSLVLDVPFEELLLDGLSETFSETSGLGHEYKARVKIVKDHKGGVLYDAIVLALGKTDKSNLSDIRIKNIVKEAKGFAGYVDMTDRLIYAPTWQLNIADWIASGVDSIDEKSIVVKTGFSKRDYEYISRVEGIGTATMETDLYMGARSINNVKDFYINNSVEVKKYIGSGTTNVGNITADNKVNFRDNIDVGKYINFPNGFAG